MEFLKYYEFELKHQHGKVNLVAEALSWKVLHMSSMMVREQELIEKFWDMNLNISLTVYNILDSTMKISSEMTVQILKAQQFDVFIQEKNEQVVHNKTTEIGISPEGMLKFKGRICTQK